jgi:hypothetical protein
VARETGAGGRGDLVLALTTPFAKAAQTVRDAILGRPPLPED